jgi:hypothetical protein
MSPYPLDNRWNNITINAGINDVAQIPSQPPIGSIHLTINPKNPNRYYGGTYWQAFGKWRMLMCVDNESSIANLKDVENTGGAYTHTHVVDTTSSGGEGWPSTGTIPSSPTQSASSLPPYITVYMRIRISLEQYQQNVASVWWDKQAYRDTFEFWVEDIVPPF